MFGIGAARTQTTINASVAVADVVIPSGEATQLNRPVSLNQLAKLADQ